MLGLESITKEEINSLKRKRYTPLEVIGEGNTRRVLELDFNPLNKKRVAKILKNKDEINDNSVWVKISMSKQKGDPNNKELLCAGKIDHPYVASIIDTIKSNGKVMNIEKYFDGDSVKEHVEKWGPIKERFEEVSRQIIDAVYYLNEEEGILHRDIKPSNVLVNGKSVMLTDLQNAAYIRNIADELLPSRGGTYCSHPVKLLEPVVKGEKSKADKKTETYALGTTLYYLLTGKFPFDYNLTYDKDGNEIKVDDEKIKVSLTRNGKRIKEVSVEDHEKEMKKRLKEIPWQYRNFLYRGMSLRDKWKDYSVSDLKTDFEKSCRSKKQLIWQQMKRKTRLALGTLAGSALISYIFGFGIGSALDPRMAPPVSPTLQDLLRNKNYEYVPANHFREIDEAMAIEMLKPYSKGLEEKLESNKKDIDNVLKSARFITRIHRDVDKRILNAYILSCVLENSKNLEEITLKEERITPFLIPKYFIQVASAEYPVNSNSLDDLQKIGWTAKYLNLNYNLKGDLADLYAETVCSKEEIAAAMQRSGSTSYFPTTDSTGRRIYEGYRTFIPYEKQRIIDMGSLLYLNMDEEGNLQLGKLPKEEIASEQVKKDKWRVDNRDYLDNNKPINGLVAR